MPYCEHAPPPHLARHVECFWSMEGEGQPHLVLPDGCEDIVFVPATGSLAAVGAMTKARVHEGAEVQSACGLRFRPGMARAFLQAPGAALTDTNVELAALWGARGEQLRRRMSGAANARQMTRMLEDELRPAREITETQAQKMIRWVVEKGGQVSLPELTRFAGHSERHLRRVFLEHTGLTPKLFSRVLRFQRVVKSVAADSVWVELALANGYYDQSHFANEFRELSGLTPREYKARL